jgi:hypothetical protein
MLPIDDLNAVTRIGRLVTAAIHHPEACCPETVPEE